MRWWVRGARRARGRWLPVGAVVGLVAVAIGVVVLVPGASPRTDVDPVEGLLTRAASGGVRVASTEPRGELTFLPGTAFTAHDPQVTTREVESGCVAASDDDDWIDAELLLPDGATIDGIEVFYHDADDGDLTVELVAHDTVATAGHATPERTVVHSVTSPPTAPGHDVMATFDASSPAAAVVDTYRRTYTAQARMGSGQQLCGVLVHWRPAATDALAFRAVTPCAVFDTRPGRGGQEQPVDGGAMVAIDTIRPDYSSQGGVDGDCGIPAARAADGSRDGTVAVMVNLVVLSPQGDGNLKAWDPDEAEADGGLLVYTHGESSNAVVPVAVADATHLRDRGGAVMLRNNGGRPAHVRAVVVGYLTGT